MGSPPHHRGRHQPESWSSGVSLLAPCRGIELSTGVSPKPDAQGIAEALRSGPVLTDLHASVLDINVENIHHGESLETDASGPTTAQPSPDEVVQVDQDLDLAVLGEMWRVELRLVSDEGNSNWLTVLPDQSGANPKLSLTVNQAHPFMRAYCELPGQELEPVWRVAVALGLGQELARRGGAKQPGLVTMHVNNVLRDVLSKKV